MLYPSTTLSIHLTTPPFTFTYLKLRPRHRQTERTDDPACAYRLPRNHRLCIHQHWYLGGNSPIAAANMVSQPKHATTAFQSFHIYNLNPTPHPKKQGEIEIGKKNAATFDQRTRSGAGGPASFTGGAASPVSAPSVGAWLETKQKASAVSFAPPFMTGHHFYSMSWSSFFLLVLSISSVQCLISNATWSLTRPHHQTTPSLRWWKEGARLSVAYKEIIKEHASSGRWNLKELLLNHKAKLPRNKQIKFHEILIDSAY